MTVVNSSTILPHGGTLVDRILTGEGREAALSRAASLTRVALPPVNLADLELIAAGVVSPLTGFMGRDDYTRVVKDMHLASGPVWSIPVTLAVTAEQAAAIAEGQEIALCETVGAPLAGAPAPLADARILAVMTVTEKYTYDKQLEAREVNRTTEEAHPGVARVYRQGDVLLGGDVWLIDWPSAHNNEFPERRYTPTQTRQMFAERGWRRVVGFQTRNPIHRAHEYIQKTALEIVDGLFINPLVGETKADDIPADVRMQSYDVLLKNYYPADRASS